MIDVELANGQRVVISDAEAQLVYEQLHRLVGSVDARIAATLLERERRRDTADRRRVRLDAAQSIALRKVIGGRHLALVGDTS